MALMKLTDFFKVEIKDRILSDGTVIPDGEAVKIKDIQDYDKIFQRHWQDYRENNINSKKVFIEVTTEKLNNLISIIKSEVKPESYLNIPEYRHYLYFVNEYLPKVQINDQTGKEKPYKSKNRAMALCLLKAKNDGKIDETTWHTKTKIKETIKRKFPGASDKVYIESRNEYLWEQRDKHPEDLKHALELYREHFEKPG